MGDAQMTQQADDGPPFPTFTERKVQDGISPWASEAYSRLIWPITGEFPSAISVMKVRQSNTGDAEPLFNPATGEWHEIASHSITRKKVSAIEVLVRNLDAWSYVWEYNHMDHADPKIPGCEYITYGDLSDDDRPFTANPMREDWTWDWEEDSDKEFLVRCCGEDRPLGKAGRTMEVRPSEGNDFVTVKDYVGAVHPWIVSMRDDIIGALETEFPCHPSTNLKLSTDRNDAPRHRIKPAEYWDIQNPSSRIQLYVTPNRALYFTLQMGRSPLMSNAAFPGRQWDRNTNNQPVFLLRFRTDNARNGVANWDRPGLTIEELEACAWAGTSQEYLIHI